MCDRERLLRQLQIHQFAITEVTFYLDGHPTCKNALAYYEKHRRMLAECNAQYIQQYGPMTQFENCNPDRWTWVDGPWPWEMEA